MRYEKVRVKGRINPNEKEGLTASLSELHIDKVREINKNYEHYSSIYNFSTGGSTEK